MNNCSQEQVVILIPGLKTCSLQCIVLVHLLWTKVRNNYIQVGWVHFCFKNLNCTPSRKMSDSDEALYSRFIDHKEECISCSNI
jgi:hypothetical protein